jgi:hypothetical protein
MRIPTSDVRLVYSSPNYLKRKKLVHRGSTFLHSVVVSSTTKFEIARHVVQ